MKIITLCILLFITLGCNKNDDSTSFSPQTISPTLIYNGGYGNFNYNPTLHGEVITSQSDWDNFRTNYWLYGFQINEANNINFNNEMLLLAFDAPRTTTSGTLEVNFDSIIENQNNITAHLSISGQAGLGQMPSRICHFVKIPKSNKPIVFQ
ncbi:hypothetical protein [Flavobacterium sp. SUN046]|uniref:hypothetical protein n=1 Tax=Flavobacterium sp. SUN046 TaxID=3002440 RepID=UPI002DB67E19|nr:hypothetical protein [Flavobacterium sp. SUN046]